MTKRNYVPRALVMLGIMLVSIPAFLIVVPQSTGWSEIGDNIAILEEANLRDSFLVQENMSVTHIPLCYAPNETVYLKDLATYTKLYSWDEAHGFRLLYTQGGGRSLRSLIVANDGSLIASLDNNSLVRSTNGGISFSHTLTTGSGTWVWRMAIRNDAVYAGEYGNPTGYSFARLWASPSNGANGTWVGVATTPTEVSSTCHVHFVGVDPYTENVWMMSGDEFDSVKVSTDGATFTNYSAAWQYTAMAFTESNIYFGNDPNNDIWCRNRTTGEISRSGYLTGVSGVSNAVYSMATGAEEVLYASTVPESSAGKPNGIYVSVDGRAWYRLFYFGTSSACGSGHLVGPVDGYIWFLNETSGKYTTRFRDLTADQARVLIYGTTPHATSASFTYSQSQTAYDGEHTWLSMGQDPVREAQLTFIGRQVENWCCNDSFETDESWGDATGWTLTPNSGQTANISAARTSDRAWHGTYSAKVEGFNTTVNHGRIQSTSSDHTSNPITAGSKIYASFYYSLDGQSGSGGNYGYLYAELRIYYTDATVDVLTIPTTWQSDPDWLRCVYTTTCEKAVKKAYFYFWAFGILTCYIDACQIQFNELTPHVSHGYHNTTNPSLTIGAVTYSYSGTLSNGSTESLSIGNLGGTRSISVSIEDSLAMVWQITGTRVANAETRFISFNNSVFKLDYWHNGTLEVWDEMPLDPGSWGFATPGNVTIHPGNRTNITVNAWSPSSSDGCVFNVTMASASECAVTFTMTGLLPEYGYRVTQFGDTIAVGIGSTFSFTASGNQTILVEVWYPAQISRLVMLTYDLLVMGVMISVLAASVTPLKDPKNRKPERMMKIVINAAIYIVIASALLVVVYQMFIG